MNVFLKCNLSFLEIERNLGFKNCGFFIGILKFNVWFKNLRVVNFNLNVNI